MSEPAPRPLLFLGVDGTLLPCGGAPRPSTLDDWLHDLPAGRDAGVRGEDFDATGAGRLGEA